MLVTKNCCINKINGFHKQMALIREPFECIKKDILLVNLAFIILSPKQNGWTIEKCTKECIKNYRRSSGSVKISISRVSRSNFQSPDCRVNLDFFFLWFGLL